MTSRPHAPQIDRATLNPDHRFARRLLWAAVLIALFVLAGCRNQETAAAPTALPAISPTPRSTPLPEVVTAVPVGAEENPVQMVIYSSAPRAAANFVSRFENALVKESGLNIRVLVVDRYAEALAALCDSVNGTVSVAWLDGLTYMAATAEGCGVPALIVERGVRRNAQTGETGVIIANSERSFSTVAQIEGDTVCRLSYDDFWTWMMPSLVLQSKGVNPTTDLKAINDYEDLETLIQAVADGDCDAAGIPSTALAGGEPPEGVSILETSVAFPYPVVLIPPQLPLGAQTALIEALLALADNTDSAEIMQGLLEQDALIPVTTDDFSDLTAFLESTGLDFAQLGG
ncbi:MAG: PhnD/SsuA/transferrin family substrate-binding protein [Anaerolineaceae bacterium]|nr:PhnD/SsuA/transferrin family substrate-binding protein [Anaerolineaceae bacterium]